MKNFYIQQLRPIGRIVGDRFEPVLWAAGVVYLALTVGLVHFVIPRLGVGTPNTEVFLIGALFGLIVYGTYDFTNYATLKEWSLAMTFTDTLWGATLCGLTTLIANQV